MPKLDQNRRGLHALFALGALLLATALGLSVGVHGVLLLFAAGCLLGVIGLAWQSVEALAAKSALTLEDALDLGAPSALEQQKHAVLRALKDLEFELGAGKVSREDYVELSVQYRSEARRLMQELDESLEPTRRKVEALVRERLEAENGASSVGIVAARPSSAVSARAESKPDAEPASRLACGICSADNDDDAVFCKKCGARLDVTRAEAE